jgi:trk system potassium uptake protein TrkH
MNRVWIVLPAYAALPLLGLGCMQLCKAETQGPLKEGKLRPRIAKTASGFCVADFGFWMAYLGFWIAYFGFSRARLLSYRVAWIDWPNAFMHLCTTTDLWD